MQFPNKNIECNNLRANNSAQLMWLAFFFLYFCFRCFWLQFFKSFRLFRLRRIAITIFYVILLEAVQLWFRFRFRCTDSTHDLYSAEYSVTIFTMLVRCFTLGENKKKKNKKNESCVRPYDLRWARNNGQNVDFPFAERTNVIAKSLRNTATDWVHWRRNNS